MTERQVKLWLTPEGERQIAERQALSGRLYGPDVARMALWLAAEGFPGWKLLLIFVVGTFLMRSAGCAVNDVIDREFDRHVKRTASRPVTSGALPVKTALALGADGPAWLRSRFRTGVVVWADGRAETVA